jgi:hypothetical protein
MDEAIDLAIEGSLSLPDRAAFIEAGTPSAGQETMHAHSQGTFGRLGGRRWKDVRLGS